MSGTNKYLYMLKNNAYNIILMNSIIKTYLMRMKMKLISL